tara:strand:- start:1043 stop:1225 length:183 start_codon:yes stop_codon:yes gene_type:complete
MLDLVARSEFIKNKKNSQFPYGSVNKLVEIHENNEKDASGFKPVFIKPTIEEKKTRRSIN